MTAARSPFTDVRHTTRILAGSFWLAAHLRVDRLPRAVAAALRRRSEEDVDEALGAALRRTPAALVRARRRLLSSALKQLSPPRARRFRDRHHHLVARDPHARYAIARLCRDDGELDRPLELLSDAQDPRARNLREQLEAERVALDRGVELAPGAGSPAIAPEPARVMLAVSHCLPHSSRGYAIRSHWLASELGRRGFDLEVHARLGFPESTGEGEGEGELTTTDVVDGVAYHLAPEPGVRDLDLVAYHRAASARLVESARTFRPAVIHAASDHRVGLAAIDAARRQGIPSIYEVRGLWHVSRAAKRPGYQGSQHYRLCHRLEMDAARAADRVLAITAALREVLISAGIPAERITVAPNGVDVERFAPRASDPRLRLRLGLGDSPVVGYVGTFFEFEGLELLIDAVAGLPAARRPKLLLVGDGPAYASLRARVERRGISEHAVFPGRVAYAQIPDYYALMDVLAYPRIPAEVCEIVSPLKPLEAMAMEKAVVASDVAALAEMIRPGDTGLIHRAGDVTSLRDQLDRALGDDPLRIELGRSARRWVSEHRTWASIAGICEALYRELGASPA